MEFHDINNLVEYIYFQNNDNRRINLTIGRGCENTKQFFFFCIQIFCKGLALLYGNNNKINIDNLNQEQVLNVINKMRLININVILDRISWEDLYYEEENAYKIPKNIDTQSENLSLQEYGCKIDSNEYLHIIRFALI